MLIPTSKNISTVTDMRVNTLGLLDDVEKDGLRLIFQRSSPKAVILSISEYESLMERLEDKNDELYAQSIENLPKGKGMKLSELEKEYGI